MVSLGTAERIAARTFSRVVRAGRGTAARYSSTVLGARRGFVAEPRSRGLVFFTRAMLQELPLQVHVQKTAAIPMRPLAHLSCLLLRGYSTSDMLLGVPAGDHGPVLYKTSPAFPCFDIERPIWTQLEFT